MARKSIKKNYLYNTLYQVLQFLTPLITTPYISRVLGADGIGTVSYAESIVSYFTLFASLSISTYGQREISYVQDSLLKRSKIFWNCKLLSICTSSIMFVLNLGLALTRSNSLIYLILSLNIFSVALDVTWFFQGMEEFGKIVLRNILLKLCNIAYVFLTIHSKEDVLFYAIGHVAFGLLGGLSLWGYLPKYIKKVPIKELCPFKDLKVILSLFMPTIAIQVYTVLDKTMIGAITQNMLENGYYEQALRISKITLTLVSSMSIVMIPRIGYYYEKKQYGEIGHLIYTSFRFFWFLGLPLCFGLIIVSDNFVPWFFGDGYEKVADLLKILAFLIIAIGISGITGTQYLVPTKRQNLLTKTVVLGACINFVLNMFLIPKYQSLGAAFASVAAEFAVSIAQLYYLRKELSISKLIKIGRNYYISVSVMVIWLVIVTRFLAASILNTMILVGSGVAVYFAVLLLLKDDFFVSNMQKVCGKFIRIKRN